MDDIFQEKYLKHQENKKTILSNNTMLKTNNYNLITKVAVLDVIKNRKSRRIFTNELIDSSYLAKALETSPSSCNRKAIYLLQVEPQDIEKYLVGGKGWINKASEVWLMFGNKDAYKSPNEKGFMPYLDAGFVGQTIYLLSEIYGVGCCFVNPNIREENKEEFNNKYNKHNDYFCGAIALGDCKEK